MDINILKTLLDSQNQAYKGALEIFIKQISDNINSLQTTISDLKNSLEFTQKDVGDLQQELRKYKQEKKSDQETIAELQGSLQKCEKAILDLEERANYQDDHNRRMNLQFVGVEEQPGGESWEQTATLVTNLIETKLQLPKMDIERAYRVGRREEDRGRPIVARFSRFADRDLIMRNVARLRGTQIFINEDLCPASQNVRKALLPQLKKARSEGKIAYFRHTKLIVKDKSSDADLRNPAGASAPGGAAGEASDPRIPDVGAGTSASVSSPSALRVDVSSAGAWSDKGRRGQRQSGDGSRSFSPAVAQSGRGGNETTQRTTRNTVRGGKN